MRQHFADGLAQLQPLEELGLVELNPDSMVVTPQGRLLVRRIASAFDAYLAGHQQGEKPRFSRTV